MTQLAFHRYANIFPLIEGEDFFALAEDIRRHGLRDRIDLIEIDGGLQILDGRNRYRALVWLVSTGEVLGDGWADMAGEPLTADYLADYDNLHIYVIGDEETDGDPLDYVISKNLPRRHLTDDQRRMVAADLVTMRQGRQSQTSQIENISRDQAARLLSTDIKGVDRARSVIAHAAPEIVEATRAGKVSVAAAAELAAQPVERQAEIVKALPRDAEGRLTPEVKKALAPVIKEIRAEKVAAKKERRAEREQDFGRKLQALPEKMFGVAVEDFEWHHEVWSSETGMIKHPANHYETASDALTPEDIVARCAERFACLADDCILFKWTTQPHLAIAIRTLELQGFRYVTNLVWNKERPGEARGHGYWFTGEHEICLVGVRGKVVPPATAHFRSNFSAPVGDHSEKPANIHEIIEFHWPSVPKVEFNARRARPGWTCWGFDAPSVSPQGEIAPATDASDSSSSARVGLASLIVAGEKAERGEVEGAGSRLPPSDDPVFLEWKALSAIDAHLVVTGPAVEELIERGLVIRDVDDDLFVTDDDGRDRLNELDAKFLPIANGSGATPAAEPPAPSADVAPADRGEVVSDAAAPAARADAAVSPANRPGASSNDDGLDIPAFLRRKPIAHDEVRA
ncbi:MT-A70 family methyltransferase [Bradyrhizobium sp. USDA 4452]